MHNMTTPNTPDTFVDAPKPQDFESIVNLLAVLGEANRQLGELEHEIELAYVALVDAHRERYAKLQATVTETEAALEVIARRNPLWFADKKSIGTPYGVVKFTASSEIVAASEEVSIKLIKAFGREKEFLRQVDELDKEALKNLSDTELAQFGLVRKPKENLKVDTRVVDLGKAVKAAEKSERAAAKAAKKAAARNQDS